jgi:hypothetical protein
MFISIFLLLLGSNDNVDISSLLLGLTKEKKTNSPFIYNLISSRLPYYLLVKIKKSSNNIKFELDKLKTLTSEDVDYKKQLIINNTIPNSIKSIGNSAFSNNQLTNVTISNSLEYIDHSVFSNNQLTNVTIPNSVKDIGHNAFENNQLTHVTLPNSVNFIYDRAFANNKLTNIAIPITVEYIGIGAFANNNLTKVSIPLRFKTRIVSIFGNIDHDQTDFIEATSQNVYVLNLDGSQGLSFSKDHTQRFKAS